MRREIAIPGTAYFAGTVLCVDGRRIGRHIGVWFTCAHCTRGIVFAMFSALRAGPNSKFQTKSCGCLKRAAFSRFNTTKASRMETSLMKRVFISYVSNPGATAARFSITKYVANYAWQRGRKRLKRLPLATRRDIFNLSQTSSDSAEKKYGLHKMEVLQVCRDWHSALGAKVGKLASTSLSNQMSAEEILQKLREYAPIGSFTNSILEDARQGLSDAVELLFDLAWQDGRWEGEFTSQEFGGHRAKSDYRWLYECLINMSPEEIAVSFGTVGGRFLAGCTYTLAQRKYRSHEHMARVRNGMVKPSRKNRQKVPHIYMPTPTVSPVAIALVIVQHGKLPSRLQNR
jgi:hypothetical protein